jgi:hypothetical protein
MQNSLERIFEGLQHTLREVVGPSISDPYLQSQISSVAEIVANLATRVEWNCAELRELSLRVRVVLEQAGRSAPDALPETTAVLAGPAPAAGDSNEALLQARDRHLLALREVQRWLEGCADERVEAALRDFLGWQVATEATMLRTGMFSAKKRGEQS